VLYDLKARMRDNMQIARQTLLHDGRYPSRMVLPIVPR